MSRVRRAGSLLLLAVLLAALAYSAWFRLHGGRWERVETASMGTTAPVGTLLWVRQMDPADGADPVRAGDVISFRRPGPGPTRPVYTHRVAAVHADGSLATAGDLSGPDRWRVAPGDVVGRVVHVWPYAGWAIRAAPVLLLGGILTLGLTRSVRAGEGVAVGLVGVSLTLAAALVLYQPLSGVERLGTTPDGAGATYVSTGLLPVQIAAPGVPASVLHAGEARSVPAGAATDPVRVGFTPVVPAWLWPLLMAACFLPALLETLRSRGRAAS